ncbi:MAG TPA: glycosyltransferase family 2 protein [Thermoanaerobaculia bacterium]|nr:glycosyltransferase family 2 protein [Thermoanaerobaculia bacterium]
MAVSFRSGAWLGACLETFRRSASAAGLEAEAIVVDHSEGSEGGDLTARARPDRLILQPNRGYAAGLNRGVAEASGEVVLLANPDLRFEERSLEALVAALEAGWAVVGPQFTLGPFLLPPADHQTPAAELARRRGARSPRAAAHFLRGEVARWRRVWEAGAPVAVEGLSGALLATHRGALDRVGPWDEGYFLYFEETDWLRRARRQGLRIAQVPASRVVHAWGHAARPGSRDDVYAASRRRFYHRAWGRPGAWLANAPRRPAPRLAAAPGLEPGAWSLEDSALVLVSPSPAGAPAAGARLRRDELEPALAAFRHQLAHPLPLTVAVWDLERNRLLEVLEIPDG